MNLERQAKLDFKEQGHDWEVVNHYETKTEYLTRIISPFKRQLKPTLLNTTTSYIRMMENGDKPKQTSAKHPSNS